MSIFLVIITTIVSVFFVEAKLKPLVKIKGCGTRAKVTSRIQNGREIVIEGMPWMVGVGEINSKTGFYVFCSGFIVSKFHVITSAHCVEDTSVLYVTFGSRFWAQGIRRRVGRVWISPETKSTPPDIVPFKDIAVLIMEERFVFNDQVRPICIADNFPVGVRPYTDARIAGFGRKTEHQKSDRLYAAETFLLVPRDCKEMRHHHGPMAHIEVCIANKLIGPCNGDSGGPLMIRENGIFYAVGSLSISAICPKPNAEKAIYARLDSLKDPLARFLKATL